MFGAAILVAAYTGQRTGELRALRWRDLDFLASTIHVRRNKPAGGEEGTPKSGKGRSVPLIDRAARALDALSRRENFTGPDDRGSAARTARCSVRTRSETRSTRRWRRRGSTVRPSRRARSRSTTCGTPSAPSPCGVFQLHDVQAYMGHANIQTTMIYAHHVPKIDAAKRFAEAIERERAETGGHHYPRHFLGRVEERA